MDKKIVIVLLILIVFSLTAKKEYEVDGVFSTATQCYSEGVPGTCVYVTGRISECSGIPENKWVLDTTGYNGAVINTYWDCFYETTGPLLPDNQKFWSI